jgi:photosystem II stability/assembly factor-like uncharacterized protein
MKPFRTPWQLIRICCAILTCLSAADSALAIGEWTNLGLYGGRIYDIEIDPLDPDRMFAGTYLGDGLYRSADGGASWRPVLTGQEDGELEGEATFRNTVVWSVEMAPSDPAVIWAVHNYWAEKSTDGGYSWQHFSNREIQGSDFRYCRSVAIDPNDPDTVFVGAGGPSDSNNNGTVYKTTDAGKKWTQVGPGSLNEFDYSVIDIETHPSDSRILWAMTFNDDIDGYWGTLYLSTDGGSTWDWDVKAEAFIADLVVNPHEPNVVFIATFWGIIRVEYVKDAGGNVHWDKTPVVTQPVGWGGGKNIRTLAFDPVNPDRVYAAGFSDQIGVSDDGGRSFKSWYDIGLQLVTLAVHPKQTDLLFGGDRLVGIHRSTNIVDWNAASQGINAVKVNDVAADPIHPDRLVAATSSGIYRRQKDGTWLPAAAVTYTEAFSVAFDPTDTEGKSYFAGIESHLVKTTDDGATWNYSNFLGYPYFVNDIAVAPDGRTVFVTTRDPGSVWKSVDGGGKLSRITPNDAGFDFNTIAMDPTDSQRIFAGGGNYFGEKRLGRLYASADGGDTWAVSLDKVIVNSIQIDPEDPRQLYAGCGHSGGTATPLFKSTDGGGSWIAADRGLPGALNIEGVRVEPSGDIHLIGQTGSIVKGGFDDTATFLTDGSSWKELTHGVKERFSGIWGASASDVFAVGSQGAVIRFDGWNWSPMEPVPTTDRDLNGVWGNFSSNVFAVGNDGVILHFNGRAWSAMTSPTTANLAGVWGTSKGPRAYTVGAAGTILAYDGSAWQIQPGITKAALTDVWGVSDGSAVYIVGGPRRDAAGVRRHTVLQKKSAAWQQMNTPPVNQGSGILRAVWGTSADNVFAVGDHGVILHYDGNPSGSWARMKSGSSEHLNDIGGSDDGTWIYAAGSHATILRYRDGAWMPAKIAIDKIAPWNAVTDLDFKTDAAGNRNLYAATDRQGIYISPDGADAWIHLSAPPYSVFALETGSVWVATYGVFVFQGHGYICGVVRDEGTGSGLNQATVRTDAGFSAPTRSDGIYVLVLTAGKYNLTAEAAGYKPETAFDVPSLQDGNTANFYLADPVIQVEIDNTPKEASSGVFDGVRGQVFPVEGDFHWSAGGAGGELVVPYPTGWVRLSIAPKSGFQVKGVWIDNHSHGSVEEIAIFHPESTRILSVHFARKCDGDFDGDGDVDGSDLARFAGDFGRTDCLKAGTAPCEGDFDGDGDVDGSDLAGFAKSFGRTDCR